MKINILSVFLCALSIKQEYIPTFLHIKNKHKSSHITIYTHKYA